MIKVQNN